MSAATTLSALIALLRRGGAEARAPRHVGEHQREEADGAGDVQEVEHGCRGSDGVDALHDVRPAANGA